MHFQENKVYPHTQKEIESFANTNLGVNFLAVNAILISGFDGSNFLFWADLAKKVFIYKLP